MTPGAVAPLPHPRVVVDQAVLDSPERLAGVVDELHDRWVTRRPVVVELGVGHEHLRSSTVENREPWELGASFTVLRDRLHFLVWNNNYDLRNGQPVWWWTRKAQRLGAAAGDRADIVLADGTEAWVDGGPRGPTSVPTVHSESVLCGRLVVQPTNVNAPPGGLAADQLTAAGHPSGPVRVIAPAGSGKTRTLGARFLHLVDDRAVEPQVITAVAYNTRAAREMRNRLRRSELHIRTVHSLGWAIIREHRPGVRLLGEKQVRSVLRRLVPPVRRFNSDPVGPYLEGLRDIRICLRSPLDVENTRGDCEGLAEVYDEYKQRLSDRNAVDYDDQVHEAIRILLRHPNVRARWQHHCRHVLIDEFQDLTPAYMLLLRLLASPELNVFGVGDDDQTIYGYAGADPSYLIDFDGFFPGAAETALEVNYRCPAGVVRAARRTLSNNRRRVHKTIRAAKAPTGGEYSTVTVDGQDMASVTADTIAGWTADGADARDVAVLSRVNAALLPVIAALDRRGVPFTSHLRPSMLQRTLVRAALSWLVVASDPERIPRSVILDTVRRPNRWIFTKVQRVVPRGGMSKDQLGSVGQYLDPVAAVAWDEYLADCHAAQNAAAGETTRRVLEFLYRHVGLARSAAELDSGRTMVERSTHSDDLTALLRTAAVYPDPSTFEKSLRYLLTVTRPEGVNVTSVHRVKGLEWDRVVLFGADRGLLPHRLSENVEEERRVFHVAITRSRAQTVVISEKGKPSMFLRETRTPER